MGNAAAAAGGAATEDAAAASTAAAADDAASEPRRASCKPAVRYLPLQQKEEFNKLGALIA